MAASVSPARVVGGVSVRRDLCRAASARLVWPPRPGSDAGECSDASPLL